VNDNDDDIEKKFKKYTSDNLAYWLTFCISKYQQQLKSTLKGSSVFLSLCLTLSNSTYGSE